MVVEAIWKERVIPETRIKLYHYDELDEPVKDKIREDFLESELQSGFRNIMLQDDYKYSWIDYYFPNSDLEVQYSLACCQGDGVNVYGKFDFDDLIEYSKERGWRINFVKEELGWLRENIKKYSEIKVFYNHRYNYCVVQSDDFFTTDWIYDIGECTEEQEVLLEKLSSLFCSAIRDLCKDMENCGYDFLYKISDDEMKEMSEANEWLYYEDGKLYIGDADELLEAG